MALRGHPLLANGRSCHGATAACPEAESDRPHLTYRLANAWYHTGEKPRKIIHYLLQTVPQAADDPIEGYEMLAQAFASEPCAPAEKQRWQSESPSKASQD